MRAVITGGGGFVGGYLQRELESAGYETYCFDLFDSDVCTRVDLLDKESLFEKLKEVRLDAVFHLAGQASVSLSWKNPQLTFQSNVIATLNLLDAVREINPETRILVVGSSDEYGRLREAGVDVTEDMEPKPETPYAISKLAQENLAGLYSRVYKMNICMTRSFNHGGAGQKEGFMIPDFCAGVVRIEKGLQKELKVGNLNAKRDFTHVRDVVRAYRLISECGRSGEVYNVGSGRAYSAREVLDIVLANARVHCDVVSDPLRMRVSDTPVIRCNNEKLRRATLWKPEIGIEEIVLDTLEYFRSTIAEGGPDA